VSQIQITGLINTKFERGLKLFAYDGTPQKIRREKKSINNFPSLIKEKDLLFLFNREEK